MTHTDAPKPELPIKPAAQRHYAAQLEAAPIRPATRRQIQAARARAIRAARLLQAAERETEITNGNT